MRLLKVVNHCTLVAVWLIWEARSLMPGEGGVGSLGQFRNRRCAMICALKWTGSTAEIEDPLGLQGKR